MKIAVWKNAVTFPAFKGLSDTFGSDVYQASREQLTSDLQNGRAHVALVPSDIALANPTEFDVLPAVAISSWNNPFAPLTVGSGLGKETLGIIHGVEGRLSALIAAMVLKEHYGTMVALNERVKLADGIPSDALITIPFEDQVDTDDDQAITLDLGQEWYEMTNYPFVWAVFVTVKGGATDGIITAVRDAMVFLDEHRPDFAKQWSKDPEVEDFVLNELRFRLDDMALASLTEFCDQLFYYGVTEEINPVQLASLSFDADTNSGSLKEVPIV